MANRTIFVTLRAQVGEYNRAFDEAAKKTRDLGSESEKLASKKQAFDLLGQGALAFGAAAAAGVTLAIAKFAEFDQQMSYVQAATHESASNMGLLRDAALEAGASTVFSATEAAAAIEELSKAGVETSDILGGALDGALDLAAAGGLGVARAAEIAATALQQFRLDGSEASHVADVLAAGAGKAMGSVDDLAQGLKFVGPVAASIGISLEETTGALALFAQQGIIGEQAGTSLRGVLASLTSPSKEARREIERLGIQLYDSENNFIGIENAAGELSDAYLKMDEAARLSSIGIVFGRETMTAATALYESGAEGVRSWTNAVDDQGYAALTAAQRLDNLAGDVEALGGAFDTALIQSGSASNDILRALIQTATEGVEAFTRLPEATQGVALGVAALAAAVGLTSGAFFLAVPKVAEYREALQTLGLTAQRTSRLVGTAMRGLAVGAAIGLTVEAANMALARLQATNEELANVAQTAQSADDILKSLSQGSFGVPGLDDTVLELDQFEAKLDGIREVQQNWWARFWNSDTFSLTNDLARFGETLGDIAGSDLPAAQDAFELLSQKTDGSEESLTTLLNAMPAYKEALTAQATAAGLAADDETLLAMAIGEGQFATESATEATAAKEAGLAALSGVANTAEEEIAELGDTIRGFASTVFASRDAAREFEASIDAVSESIEANGRSLDITSEAGRANEQTLDNLAQAALENAAAIYERTRSEDDARGAVQRGREELIKALEQYNITGDAAEAYADELGLIPENVDTFIDLDTSAATTKLNNWVEGMNGKRVNIATSWTGGLVSANGNLVDHQSGRLQAFSGGGFATGIYPAQANAIHKFAEPETRWEAYISGKPGMEQRNTRIALEALDRLGYNSVPRDSQRIAMSPSLMSSSVDNSMRVTQNISAPNPYEAAQLAKLKLENAFASAGEVRR